MLCCIIEEVEDEAEDEEEELNLDIELDSEGNEVTFDEEGIRTNQIYRDGKENCYIISDKNSLG